VSPIDMLTELDALVIIVPHLPYLEKPMNDLMAMLKKDGIFIDVKSAFDLKKMPELIRYWSL
jgi:UDP-N-acetyl-D-galactosamine dehydrogenase